MSKFKFAMHWKGEMGRKKFFSPPNVESRVSLGDTLVKTLVYPLDILFRFRENQRIVAVSLQRRDFKRLVQLHAYYFCSKRGHINVRAEIVHGSVDAHLRCLGSSESFLVACREEVRKHAAEEAKADAEERAAKTRKLTAAENRLRRAREALLDGTLTREEYEAEKRARRTEIAGLSVDLENTAERIALREQVCNGLIEFVHNCTGLMARVDPSDAQMLVRYLFGTATLTKKGIEPTQNSLYQKIKALETSAFANGGPAMPIVEIMARFLAVSDRIKSLRNLVDNCA